MGDERNTKERILDVAVELFTELGYDGTSLREIAERLDITKAALYYHFPSKADILGTLADRMFERMFDTDSEDGTPFEVSRDPAELVESLDIFIDRLLDNARLFAMFERNHAAMDQISLSDDKRTLLHEQRQAQLEAFMGDDSIPVEARVRYAAAIGAVFFSATHALTAFKDISTDELRATLHDVISDLVLHDSDDAADDARETSVK